MGETLSPTVCRPIGSTELHAPCATALDCPANSGCIDGPAGRTCATYCFGSIDCGPVPCAAFSPGTSEHGIGVCSYDCDPFTSLRCPSLGGSGFDCKLSLVPTLRGAGPDEWISSCTSSGTGGPGDSCTDSFADWDVLYAGPRSARRPSNRSHRRSRRTSPRAGCTPRASRPCTRRRPPSRTPSRTPHHRRRASRSRPTRSNRSACLRHEGSLPHPAHSQPGKHRARRGLLCDGCQTVCLIPGRQGDRCPPARGDGLRAGWGRAMPSGGLLSGRCIGHIDV